MKGWPFGESGIDRIDRSEIDQGKSELDAWFADLNRQSAETNGSITLITDGSCPDSANPLLDLLSGRVKVEDHRVSANWRIENGKDIKCGYPINITFVGGLTPLLKMTESELLAWYHEYRHTVGHDEPDPASSGPEWME